jgi:hypothetical protein
MMKASMCVVMCVLLASAFLLAGSEPTENRIQSAQVSSQTSVQAITPRTIALTAGGATVTATMTGTGLGNISAVQVVLQGRPAPGFEVKLAPPSSSARSFDIKALSSAEPGNYQVRIVIRAQSLVLPTGVAAVVVKAGAARPTSTRKEASTAVPPQPKVAPKKPPLPKSAAILSDSRAIRSADFSAVASSVLKDAYLNASACGGRDSERKTTANVPNAYFKQEPLDRLVYKFTDGEIEKTTRGPFRSTEIRACVDSWRLVLYGASIEDGRFKVDFKFPEIQAIKTRRMEQHLDLWWTDRWDWADEKADTNIPDYRLSGGLVIFLNPSIDNGSLSCRVADTRWEFHEPLCGWIGPQGFIPPQDFLATKIIYYKDRVLEIIRQRVQGMFADDRVRSRLAEALTLYVKSGNFAGRTIAGVSGSGDKIEVTFQK